jgi:uncharacterized protein (TIGR03067 family)
MKVSPCVLALLASITALPLAAQNGVAPPSDSVRLQGAWIMVSGAANGYELPASYAATMKRVLSGNSLTVTRSGQVFFTATIRLDPSQSPRTIDYSMTGGASAGATQLGIYLLTADTVRFCFGAPGAARPTDFATTPGDGQTLSTWLPARP